MKLTRIAAAVAVACASTSSFALTPAQIDGSTVQLWLSGATAPTASVFKAIRKLCVDADDSGAPDDLHVYLEKSDADIGSAGDASPGKSKAGKFAAYACTMGPNAGALDTIKTVVYHTFDVGSFEAYTPHLSLAGEVNPNVSAIVKRLKDITLGTSSCVATAYATPDPTYTGCGSLSVTVAANATVNATPTVPVGGFSDTEYVLNKLNLLISKDLGDIGTEQPTNVGQGFGLAASWPLYIQMQKAQGIIATVASDGEACDPDGAGKPSLTVACQPNISRQKYSSLVSEAGVTDKNAGLLGALATDPITVQRRVGTSGTQSSSNAFFLNKPCATGIPGGELSVAGSNAEGTTSYNGGLALVKSNKGSGDVKTSLTAQSTAGTYGIGVLSLENVTSGTEKFSFLKLNGVSPTTDSKQRATAIEGDYEFWYELVAFTAATAPSEGAELITKTVAALADPAITDLTGIFITAAAGVSGTNVSKGYKSGNACAVAIQ